MGCRLKQIQRKALSNAEVTAGGSVGLSGPIWQWISLERFGTARNPIVPLACEYLQLLSSVSGVNCECELILENKINPTRIKIRKKVLKYLIALESIGTVLTGRDLNLAQKLRTTANFFPPKQPREG